MLQIYFVSRIPSFCNIVHIPRIPTASFHISSMTNKPIFVATHPRACSTAFERVFMTRTDILQCVHEPFGDAYYFGPERLAERYANDEKARLESGFSDYTYRTIMDTINAENTKERRLLIKDMALYFFPPNGRPTSLAPSLLVDEDGKMKRPVTARRPSHIETQAAVRPDLSQCNKVEETPYPTPSEAGNPTVVPSAVLEQFHFAFLIRHPRSSIPSYYRCTIPPLDKVTGFYNFRSDEAGYAELRRMFDYLRNVGYVGPSMAGPQENGTAAKVEICVVDADDLLDKPAEIIEAFCDSVGIDYCPQMLTWTEQQDEDAEKAFAKWKGFHEDALHSHDLKPRKHKKVIKSDEEYYQEWTEKYGKEGADIISKTVAECTADYEYLRQFCIKV